MHDDDAKETNWPKSCRMPDLTSLPVVAPVFAYNRTFGHGPSDPRAIALSVNFVRLVDKAISDYGHAREAVLAYLAKPNGMKVGLLLLVSGHLETCVGTVVRAIDFGRGVRKTRSDKPNPIPDRPAVFRDDVYTRVNDARNAVEHLYEDVLQEKIPPGGFVILAPTEDGFEVGGKFLRYEEIAAWLTELHELARRVAGFPPQNHS